MLETNARGVPVKAMLLTVSIGFLSVILAALWPDSVFLWPVNSSGAVALGRIDARLQRPGSERLEVAPERTRGRGGRRRGEPGEEDEHTDEDPDRHGGRSMTRISARTGRWPWA